VSCNNGDTDPVDVVAGQEYLLTLPQASLLALESAVVEHCFSRFLYGDFMGPYLGARNLDKSGNPEGVQCIKGGPSYDYSSQSPRYTHTSASQHNHSTQHLTCTPASPSTTPAAVAAAAATRAVVASPTPATADELALSTRLS